MSDNLSPESGWEASDSQAATVTPPRDVSGNSGDAKNGKALLRYGPYDADMSPSNRGSRYDENGENGMSMVSQLDGTYDDENGNPMDDQDGDISVENGNPMADQDGNSHDENQKPSHDSDDQVSDDLYSTPRLSSAHKKRRQKDVMRAYSGIFTDKGEINVNFPMLLPNIDLNREFTDVLLEQMNDFEKRLDLLLQKAARELSAKLDYYGTRSRICDEINEHCHEVPCMKSWGKMMDELNEAAKQARLDFFRELNTGGDDD